MIESGGRYLITQRRTTAVLPNLWEFPGGKVEPGERDEDALRREIRERLDADVRVSQMISFVRHPYERYTVDLHLYQCELLSDVQVFDVWRDAEALGPARRSLALRLTFQAQDRTLSDDEVRPFREAIVEHLRLSTNDGRIRPMISIRRNTTRNGIWRPSWQSTPRIPIRSTPGRPIVSG